jgi:membrane associated rhomboid family serine protease
MVLSLKNIQEGRYYTLLTSTFTHYHSLHLALNMMTLWSFGRTIVGVYGVPTFAILWVGSGLVGGALQVSAWKRNIDSKENPRAVGASGSLFGMVSFLACVIPGARVSLLFVPMSLKTAVTGAAAFTVLSIHQGWLPFIAHWDHLGGMLFGATWWLVMLRRGRVVRW